MSSGVKVYLGLIRFVRIFLLSSFSCGGDGDGAQFVVIFDVVLVGSKSGAIVTEEKNKEKQETWRQFIWRLFLEQVLNDDKIVFKGVVLSSYDRDNEKRQ